MFNKKTRRNFRQRKQASSEDEGEQENNVDEEEKSEAVAPKKQLHPIQRRGISCSSKQGQGSPKPPSTVEDDGESSKGAEERKMELRWKQIHSLVFLMTNVIVMRYTYSTLDV